MSRLTSTYVLIIFIATVLYVWKTIEKIYTANQNFGAFGGNARSRSAHQQFIKHLYKKHSVRAVANSLFVRNILWNSKSNPTFIARFISRKFKNDILATACYIEEPFVTSLVQLSTIVIQNMVWKLS